MVSKKKGLAKIELEEDEATVLASRASWTKRVNVDIPVWAIQELDKEANRRGITRQSLIKTWLIDKLDALKAVEAG